jgi:hypothetical protein
MAIVLADWSVDRQTGNIRYIGDDHDEAAPSYATVIEFHRWLQDLADDAEYVGDDEVDIISTNPSSRSTDNIVTLLGNYNIDDTAAEHLYDGSIIQLGGDVIYDGVVNFGNPSVQIQLIQNGAVLSDDWWNYDGGGLNADPGQGISHRFMLKTRTGGSDIDGRRVIGTSRTFGNTYSEFRINGTSRGNNVLALSDTTDLNNQTAEGTVAGWAGITNLTEGYAAIDVNNDGTPEYFYSEWDRDSFSINQLYERMKWLTRQGSSSTLYGLNGQLFRGITHQVALSGSNSGNFDAYEPVSWPGGTGQMLAIDDEDASAATKMWIQLLTGVAPTNGQLITGGSSSATATASGVATERPISAPFCGVSTGSALIGAYGFGVEYTGLSAADTLFDLNNIAFNPPNNVTFTVFGLVNGVDRVLVGPWDGVATDLDGNPEIDYNQFTLNGALTGAAVTSVVVNGSIPSDTPATGTIRVSTNSGLVRRVPYTSWSGSTFTIPSTDFSADNADNGNNVFISYIDLLASGSSASFTGVFSSPRQLVVKVRNGGGSPIKEFISSATLGATGGSVTAIRTVDT